MPSLGAGREVNAEVVIFKEVDPTMFPPVPVTLTTVSSVPVVLVR
jgi:hypothetical protein